ncbi:MAG: protein phosphatase 2C domain-containing protein [Isosphaeraceae bacterium]
MGVKEWWKNFWRPLRPGGANRPDDFNDTAEYAPVSSLLFPNGPIRLRAGIYTTVGNYREHNEDNYYVPGIPSLRPIQSPYRPRGGDPLASDIGPAGKSGEVTTDPTISAAPSHGLSGLYIVADGMGGQMAGERASQMAVDIIPIELGKRLGDDPTRLDDRAIRDAIRDAVGKANDEILAQSHLDTECSSMGTTVVLSYFCKDRAYIAGIGDSRAYRLRDRKIELLTEDHSLAHALGKAGTIRPEEVETHKFKHVLYLYLGSRDVGAGPEDVRVLDLRPGDRYLLASDGLTGSVADHELAQLLAEYNDPQKAAEVLARRAIEAQSKDNVTCLVVHVEPAVPSP